VRQALTEMGLDEPDRLIDAYPHQLSGGMLQRAMIASAIIGRPAMLIADEPTSALDVTVQRQILALLRRIRDEHQLTILLISHDLGAVAQIADRLMVVYAGRNVETGVAKTLLAAPRHPYTRGLIESSPGRGQPHKSKLLSLGGAPLGPHEVDADHGCPFRWRCPRALAVCAESFPSAAAQGPHTWFCHNPEPGS
jgi:peptide/nickel transport system ATP-binding protein